MAISTSMDSLNINKCKHPRIRYHCIKKVETFGRSVLNTIEENLYKKKKKKKVSCNTTSTYTKFPREFCFAQHCSSGSL